MGQDQDIKKKNFRCYKEVKLRESEFKKASELDSDELKNIHDEYFKRTFVYYLIGILIGAAVFALYPSGILFKLGEFSEPLSVALMFVVAFGGAMIPFFFVHCIFSLRIASKIKRKDFWCHEGRITHRKSLWSAFARMELYYIVDDEYCSRAIFDPFYIKKTEAYFLYFPGFMKSSLMGGIVVRKKE